MSRNVWQRTFRYVRTAKTQIRLHTRAVWSKSSFSSWRNFASLAIQDSDQTAGMRRLIWIFAWRTCQNVRFLTLRLKNVFPLTIQLNSFNDIIIQTLNLKTDVESFHSLSKMEII